MKLVVLLIETLMRSAQMRKYKGLSTLDGPQTSNLESPTLWGERLSINRPSCCVSL